MQVIDLSHTLVTDMAVYPGDETRVLIERISEHGPGSHQSSALGMGCHTGTHIDLPLHFREGEPDLSSFPVAGCLGRAVVLPAPQGEIGPDVLDDLDPAALDFVIFRTGWQRRWGTPAYYRDWPFLARETAERLADADLRGVGLDSPSVDPLDARTAHEILAAAGLINVENLSALERLPDEPFLFLALPLRLAGAEASPVRAIALI